MQHRRKRGGVLKSALLSAATLGALILAGAGVARADTITIGYSTGSSSTITNVVKQSSPYSYSGSGLTAGVFTISQLNATGTPPLVQPTLDTQTLDTSSTGAGSLTLYIVETGITAPLGSYNLETGFATNTFQNGGTGSSVTESVYADPSNTDPETSTWNMSNWVQLGSSATFTDIGTSNPVVSTPDFKGTYALITKYTIVAGNSNFTSSNTINLTNVPEPGSLALLGTGLLGLGLVARRRRRKV